MAGGTDVYVNMHGGKDHSLRVLDIKRLKELQGQRFSVDSGLDLGALTSHRRIEEWDIIKKHYYAMFQGCSQVGSVQIRYRGTLGGNIMNGAPSADSIGPMLVHNAQVVVANPQRERSIPLDAFYTGFKKFDIQPDELLTRIRIPMPPGQCRQRILQVYAPQCHGSGADGRQRLCGGGTPAFSGMCALPSPPQGQRL